MQPTWKNCVHLIHRFILFFLMLILIGFSAFIYSWVKVQLLNKLVSLGYIYIRGSWVGNQS